MLKKEFIEIIEKYVSENDPVATLGFWTRDDVLDDEQQPLNNEEWARFVYWFENYADTSYEYNEALHYAIEKREK